MYNKYMKLAVDEAYRGIKNGDGGPFGSVIVKGGEVIAAAHNLVVANSDPTCHGEIQAIREACKKLESFDLSGCELYTTAEPCPMCLSACLWANIEKVYYGCRVEDTDTIGFRDLKFYSSLNMKLNRPGYLNELDRESCLALFEEYRGLTDKTNY